jgi:hypothetical protein
MSDIGSIALFEATLEVEPKQTQEQYCLTTAELAECTCPEFCERDHDTD